MPTDEEVLQILNAESGVTPPQEGLSDSEVSDILQGSSAAQDPTTGSLDISRFTSTQGPGQSPLSIFDRAMLSFADDVGRETVLKEKFKFVQRLDNGKFAVGNDPRNLQPIDPEGVFNDFLGDMADLAGEVPVIAGQVLGALGGFAAGNIPGAIAGGAGGAAAGQAARIAIGKGLGINQQTAEEAAVDVLLTGAFGAAGEGLGAALGVAARSGARAMLPRVGRIMERVTSGGTPQAASATKALPQLFQITAGVPQEATRIALRRGPARTFAAENFVDDTVTNIVSAVQKDVLGQKGALGAAVNKATGELISKSRGRAVINITSHFRRLADDLQNVGYLSKGNMVNPNFASGKDASVFKRMLNQISQSRSYRRDVLGRAGRRVGTQKVTAFVAPKEGLFLTVDEAVRLQRQFGTAFDNLSPQGQQIMTRFLRGEKTGLIRGLTQELDDIATQVGAFNYRAANQTFSEFADLTDGLRGAGLDFNNRVSIENFIRNIPNSGQEVKSILARLDAKTPTQIVDSMERFSAAQMFKSANPNLLRLGAVAGLLGASRAKTPEGKAGFLGLALLVGSPAGARHILRTGDVAGQAIRRAATAGGKRAAGVGTTQQQKAVGRALLSRLLQKSSRDEKKNRQR